MHKPMYVHTPFVRECLIFPLCGLTKSYVKSCIFKKMPACVWKGRWILGEIKRLCLESAWGVRAVVVFKVGSIQHRPLWLVTTITLVILKCFCIQISTSPLPYLGMCWMLNCCLYNFCGPELRACVRRLCPPSAWNTMSNFVAATCIECSSKRLVPVRNNFKWIETTAKNSLG